MKLEGKVAVITGGTMGIGRAIAELFAREGAKVAIAGRSPGVLQETEQAIARAGGAALAIEADVQRKQDVDRMMATIMEHWSHIDIAVCNAGICSPAPFLDITEEDWDRHMNINLKGAFLVGQAAARQMAAQGSGGSIIHVSSVNGLAAEAEQAHYNTTKGGMNLLSMSMALELAPLGIRVNTLCPGFIDTRLTRPLIDNEPAMSRYVQSIPLGRVGTPEEIAKSALFLASDDSLYMTGHHLVVDGGQLIKLS